MLPRAYSLSHGDSATALRALQSVDDNMKTAKIDLKAVYTNDFVRKANAKYPKG